MTQIFELLMTALAALFCT